MRRILVAMLMLGLVSPVLAHWETQNPLFPWATPGQMRWLIDYSTMAKPHVELMRDAGFNFLQGGGFSPEALEVIKADPELRAQQYICSRTIYHEILFPKYPELKDAAILNPDGSYKIIYNNPKRYAGCWNRPAWLSYIKERMDEIHTRGIETIFFDNPMTWACYCPTCQELFTAFAKEKTGQELKLNQFGKATELENWFNHDTAIRFWTQVRDYAHGKGMLIVANNMTYWLINQGLTDGVFSEGNGHSPFGQDIAAYKIGLAVSHGKPTGILDYVPGPVRQARGKTEFNHSSGSGNKWVGAPVAEEFQVALAQGVACGGNYIANFSLELGRRIEQLTVPEDQKIVDGLKLYNGFIREHPEVYAQVQPGSSIALLYSLTRGPREGEILGHQRGGANKAFWPLIAQGLPIEVIVEDDLRPERLKGVRTIVVTDVSVLEPEAAQRLADFARAGGRVVLMGATSVRGRYESPEQARPITRYFPGVRAVGQREFAPADFATEGYEVQPPWLKVTEGVGKATATFEGDPGEYRFALSYFDESDGQGSFEILVDGKQVGSWQNTHDDDQTHVHLSEPVRLKPGAVVTVVGHSGGGEYGRIERLAIVEKTGAAPLRETRLGRGSVVQTPVAMAQLPAAELAALARRLQDDPPVRAATPLPPKVLLNLTRGRDGRLCAHIVNYDFRYDDKYALQSIEPTPVLTLQSRGAKRATLLTPGEAPRDLAVKAGVVEVPPVRIYGVVVLD